jgi:hypothetical protein
LFLTSVFSNSFGEDPNLKSVKRLKKSPTFGEGTFLERAGNLKKRSVYSTVKDFYNRLLYFAFATHAGHRVHSTFGGNLHQLVVKGFQIPPFPFILYKQKNKKQALFSTILKYFGKQGL